jgi:hypothetical protein
MPTINEIQISDKTYTQNQINYIELYNSYFGNNFNKRIDIE